MADENNLQKLKQEYPELFKGIPDRFVEIVCSNKTASHITEICLKNGVEDEEKIEGVAHQIGLILLGKMPPKELSLTLEKEIKIDLETAKKIYLEIDEAIFSPIKDELNELYGSDGDVLPEEKEPEKSTVNDTYRETIE